METLSARLERRHAAVRAWTPLRYFTWTTRILLAVGFVPSGLTKALGYRFTQADPASSDMGLMFEGIYQAGLLYPFIGLCQLTAALLLVIPRTALLGACVYLPLIAGIEIITATMDFRGTVVITTLMLLGNIYLLCWDYPRLKPIIARQGALPATL